MAMQSLCKQCGDAPTVRAHIFPQSAIRSIRTRGPDTKTLAVFDDRAIVARSQNGIYDQNILCKDCDGLIGELDKWFAENLDKLHASVVDKEPFCPATVGIDAGAALRFAVSVIYRASLSHLHHFEQISLGSYVEAAGKIAISAMDTDAELPVVLINVLTSDQLDMRQWAFYPVRCVGDNGPYFVFTLSGVQFLVKFGGRHPGVTSDDDSSAKLTIRPGNDATIVSYPFVESAEAGFLMKVQRSGRNLS